MPDTKVKLHWWWGRARGPTRQYQPVKVATYPTQDRTEVWYANGREAEVLVEFSTQVDPRRNTHRLTDADGGEWVVSKASCGCGAPKYLRQLKL